jgi:aquaporin Z
MRRLLAEFLGTFMLVFFAVGSAVYGMDTIGFVGVALAFGLTLVALVYTLGPISGCHVNPAVTMAMLLTKRLPLVDAVWYWIVQLLGGLAAAALLRFTVTSGGITDQTDALGANNYGVTVNLTGAVMLEALLTFLLVFVVLAVTGKTAATPAAGVAIGVALAIVHLVGLPLTGTSVNPARSLGPALFAGGESLSHLWVFIVSPLVGGVLAAGVYPLLFGREAPKRMAVPEPTEPVAEAATPVPPAAPA